MKSANAALQNAVSSLPPSWKTHCATYGRNHLQNYHRMATLKAELARFDADDDYQPKQCRFVFAFTPKKEVAEDVSLQKHIDTTNELAISLASSAKATIRRHKQLLFKKAEETFKEDLANILVSLADAYHAGESARSSADTCKNLPLVLTLSLTHGDDSSPSKILDDDAVPRLLAKHGCQNAPPNLENLYSRLSTHILYFQESIVRPLLVTPVCNYSAATESRAVTRNITLKLAESSTIDATTAAADAMDADGVTEDSLKAITQLLAEHKTRLADMEKQLKETRGAPSPSAPSTKQSHGKRKQKGKGQAADSNNGGKGNARKGRKAKSAKKKGKKPKDTELS